MAFKYRQEAPIVLKKDLVPLELFVIILGNSEV